MDKELERAIERALELYWKGFSCNHSVNVAKHEYNERKKRGSNEVLLFGRW